MRRSSRTCAWSSGCSRGPGAIPGCATPEVAADERALQTVNERLWDIEDRIRDKEAVQTFDRDFIELARAVYIENDERAAHQEDGQPEARLADRRREILSPLFSGQTGLAPARLSILQVFVQATQSQGERTREHILHPVSVDLPHGRYSAKVPVTNASCAPCNCAGVKSPSLTGTP